MEKINILDMADIVIAKLREFGFSDNRVNKYISLGAKVMVTFFIRNNQTCYDKTLADELYRSKRDEYASGKISYFRFGKIRKFLDMSAQYYATGKMEWHASKSWKYQDLDGYFGEIFERYRAEKISVGVKPRTIDSYKCIIKSFIEFLQSRGHESFESVTKEDIHRAVIHLSKTREGYGILTVLNSFFKFLHEKNLSPFDMSKQINIRSKRRFRIIPGYKDVEIETIIDAIDRNTLIGKRDYAIVKLGEKTGLRGVDIRFLKLTDIDWKNNTISIVQQKTRKPLSLPLEPEVGNAVADYILNARPVSDIPYIFLSANKPVRMMSGRAICERVEIYSTRGGIDRPKNAKGFHCFRRSFGVKMLEADVNLSLISELLGHTDMDSIKPYLSINETALKNCCLSFAGIEVRQRGLK